MHEWHLLKDLLADVLQHAQQQEIHRVTTLYLRMGEFTEIDPEILTHFFKENSRGTVAEGARIQIEKSPARELRLLSFDGE